jgi:ActR/RegA family two-component response regulator
MTQPKVLLVDDDDSDLFLTRKSLERQNCEVVPATSVTEALKQIVTQRFDVLITDLHMPDPGDGFAVVTAMRHFQPDVLNLVCSGYPDVDKSMAAIVLQADNILVKPFEAAQLAALMSNKLHPPKPSPRPPRETVASILDRDEAVTIQRWLSRVERVAELTALPLATKERTEYLPAMIRSITTRLRSVRDVDVIDSASPTAVAHGQLRFRQGYTAPMIVQESRILQVCIFETIQRNMSTVDFSTVLPDIMIIADEVDCQLKQAIDSFLTMQRAEVAFTPSLPDVATIQLSD